LDVRLGAVALPPPGAAEEVIDPPPQVGLELVRPGEGQLSFRRAAPPQRDRGGRLLGRTHGNALAIRSTGDGGRPPSERRRTSVVHHRQERGGGPAGSGEETGLPGAVPATARAAPSPAMAEGQALVTALRALLALAEARR